ncbi:MAG: glycerol-3-phosphate ABC transporter ATP-binding protein [Chloroflexota bacterium]
MADPLPIIQLRNLRKEFNGTVAVAGLDLDVLEGEFLCFLGPSGCGKTTTLRMIAGLETPTAGEIYLRGQRITDLPPQQRGLGFVFQNYALFWHMTVFDNLAFGLKVRGLPPAEIEARVKEVARGLELEALLGQRAARLDLSAMQRVAMGRTLITQPQVLLLDEPLNNFRPGLREIMRAELKRLQLNLGRTMIYVTHDQEEALTMGDRVLVMNTGRVEQLGTPREITEHPASLFVASFIGRPPMNFIPADYCIEGGRALLRHGSLTWDVTPWRQAIEAQVRDGRVIVGVGPADIVPLALAPHGEGEPLRTQVDLVQPLARQKILELKVDDLLLKVVVPGTFQVQAGEMLDVVMPSRALHLFDPLTEKAILLY